MRRRLLPRSVVATKTERENEINTAVAIVKYAGIILLQGGAATLIIMFSHSYSYLDKKLIKIIQFQRREIVLT
jgi:hypothetical protein